MPCRVGWNGIGTKNREGDKITPVGEFGLTTVLYRPDRINKNLIKTSLPLEEITPFQGWCDDPNHLQYNQKIEDLSGFQGSHEKLYMEYNDYDLIIPVTYNMNPIESGKGSAIFIHLESGRPTAGCIAFSQEHLLKILEGLTPKSTVEISSEGIKFLNLAPGYEHRSNKEFNS